MWNNDWNTWGWAAWCLMAGTTIVIIGIAVWLAATLTRRNNPSTNTATPAPEDILADRFARGDLSEDDYLRQRELLRSTPVTRPDN